VKKSKYFLSIIFIFLTCTISCYGMETKKTTDTKAKDIVVEIFKKIAPHIKQNKRKEVKQEITKALTKLEVENKENLIEEISKLIETESQKVNLKKDDYSGFEKFVNLLFVSITIVVITYIALSCPK